MPTPTRQQFAETLETTEPFGGVINKKTLSYFGFGILAIFGLVTLHSLFGTNNAGFFAVKQAAGTGTLTVINTPGMFMRAFGDVTYYKASDILYFSKHENESNGQDDSVLVRFNDGATANVTVNARVDLPSDPEKLLDIHRKYRSYDALIKDTVKQVISESVLLTASMMSAEESYTTKRAEFSQLAEDQVLNGIFLTDADVEARKDPKTGEITRHQGVVIQRDSTGKPERKSTILAPNGIRISQFVIRDIDYSPEVDKMIGVKQTALQETVSAKANAEKAVQDRLTAEEVGKKNVAVARYQQEVKKQEAITEAEQRLEVARLGRQAEEQNKLANIAKGEGEGEYRRKLMIADGALDKKLAAYVSVQQAWATAFQESKNPVVPSTVFGGGTTGGNATQQFMDILTVKAAKDLSLTAGAK